MKNHIYLQPIYFTNSNSKTMLFKVVEVTIFHFPPFSVISMVGVDAMAAFLVRNPTFNLLRKSSYFSSLVLVYFPVIWTMLLQQGWKATKTVRGRRESLSSLSGLLMLIHSILPSLMSLCKSMTSRRFAQCLEILRNVQSVVAMWIDFGDF